MKWNRGSRHISQEFTRLDIKTGGRAPPLATDVGTLALEDAAGAAGNACSFDGFKTKKNWSKGFDRLTG